MAGPRAWRASRSWYYEHLLERDLDAQGAAYGPLLDAYLHGNGGPVVGPAQADAGTEAWVDRMLDRGFPQSPHPLNASQRRAVHLALRNPLTVILGPPGTGKTETILCILALAVARGESVAMVSSNRGAVNKCAKQCVARLGPLTGSARYTP